MVADPFLAIWDNEAQITKTTIFGAMIDQLTIGRVFYVTRATTSRDPKLHEKLTSGRWVVVSP